MGGTEGGVEGGGEGEERAKEGEKKERTKNTDMGMAYGQERTWEGRTRQELPNAESRRFHKLLQVSDHYRGHAKGGRTGNIDGRGACD